MRGRKVFWIWGGVVVFVLAAVIRATTLVAPVGATAAATRIYIPIAGRAISTPTATPTLVPTATPIPVWAPWPMFGHDTERTGRSANVAIQNPVLEWSVPDQGVNSAFAPVIGPDGTIYVGWTYDGGPSQIGPGYVSAISPEGQTSWQDTFPGQECSPLAIDAAGNIYLTLTQDGLTEITPSGAVAWAVPVSPYTFPSQPVIAADGSLYVSGYNSVVLYAFGS